MIYKNCRVLPIHVFNEIGITGDLNLLIYDKAEHTEEEVNDAWLDIITEYIDIHPTNSLRLDQQDKVKLSLMISRINIVSTMMDFQIEDEDLFKELGIKKGGLKREFNKLRAKITQLRSAMGIDKEIKRESQSFERTLIKLSKVYKFKIDRYTTTVTEWLQFISEAEDGERNRNKGD